MGASGIASFPSGILNTHCVQSTGSMEQTPTGRVNRPRYHASIAAVTPNSTRSPPSRDALTHARRGRLARSTHSSHARLNSGFLAMSVMYVITLRMRDLSVPASCRFQSIAARASRAWSYSDDTLVLDVATVVTMPLWITERLRVDDSLDGPIRLMGATPEISSDGSE